MLGLTITALATAALLNGATCTVEDMGFYSMTTVAVEVDEENDVVTVVDFNGNEWGFSGVRDYYEGDYIDLMLCDNGTEIIYDDVICDTHYSGWLNGDFGNVVSFYD